MVIDEDYIYKYFTSCMVEGMREALDTNGFTYTGRAKGSLKAQKNKVKGVKYIKNLIWGQPPNCGLSWESIKLRQWCINKLFVKPPAKTAAFLIARKINKEGSQIYRGDRDPLPVFSILNMSKKGYYKYLKERIRLMSKTLSNK